LNNWVIFYKEMEIYTREGVQSFVILDQFVLLCPKLY
jgi:hypothetical protein